MQGRQDSSGSRSSRAWQFPFLRFPCFRSRCIQIFSLFHFHSPCSALAGVASSRGGRKNPPRRLSPRSPACDQLFKGTRFTCFQSNTWYEIVVHVMFVDSVDVTLCIGCYVMNWSIFKATREKGMIFMTFFAWWGGGALRGGEQRGFPVVSLSLGCSVGSESRAERPRSASSTDLQLPHQPLPLPRPASRG